MAASSPRDDASERHATPAALSNTRSRIMAAVLKQGPVAASDIAEQLGMTTAGVRRHLDIVVAEGLARAITRPARSVAREKGTGQAARGRPARSYVVTQKGREQFGHGYDALADLALEQLRRYGGNAAVRVLAKERIREIVGRVPPAGHSADSIEATARALAEAFDEHGYAATVTTARGSIQICQHHCPVSQVAAKYPELCEAEHRAISELTGLHVQPLASIANGNSVCTTNIPLAPHLKSPDERSGS